MEFSSLIRHLRIDLGLGVRETARKTVSPFVPSPIKSAVYISRLESGNSEEMPVESVTIDKMWALGTVLLVNPFELFLSSRDKEYLLPELSRVTIRECAPALFGDFLRARRADLGLSIREASERATPWDVSLGYWSQMETDFRHCSSKISGEKLWSIGTALGIDPLLLYVLSRGIDARYLNAISRERLFK